MVDALFIGFIFVLVVIAILNLLASLRKPLYMYLAEVGEEPIPILSENISAHKKIISNLIRYKEHEDYTDILGDRANTHLAHVYKRVKVGSSYKYEYVSTKFFL